MVIDMVGKTFRSRIDGKKFLVEGLVTDNKQQRYIVKEMKTGKRIYSQKRTFEEMCKENLVLIKENKQ